MIHKSFAKLALLVTVILVFSSCSGKTEGTTPDGSPIDMNYLRENADLIIQISTNPYSTDLPETPLPAENVECVEKNNNYYWKVTGTCYERDFFDEFGEFITIRFDGYNPLENNSDYFVFLRETEEKIDGESVFSTVNGKDGIIKITGKQNGEEYIGVLEPLNSALKKDLHNTVGKTFVDFFNWMEWLNYEPSTVNDLTTAVPGTDIYDGATTSPAEE